MGIQVGEILIMKNKRNVEVTEVLHNSNCFEAAFLSPRQKKVGLASIWTFEGENLDGLPGCGIRLEETVETVAQ